MNPQIPLSTNVGTRKFQGAMAQRRATLNASEVHMQLMTLQRAVWPQILARRKTKTADGKMTKTMKTTLIDNLHKDCLGLRQGASTGFKVRRSIIIFILFSKVVQYIPESKALCSGAMEVWRVILNFC